jgi:hypothetical protein
MTLLRELGVTTGGGTAIPVRTDVLALMKEEWERLYRPNPVTGTYPSDTALFKLLGLNVNFLRRWREEKAGSAGAPRAAAAEEGAGSKPSSPNRPRVRSVQPDEISEK